MLPLLERASRFIDIHTDVTNVRLEFHLFIRLICVQSSQSLFVISDSHVVVRCTSPVCHCLTVTGAPPESLSVSRKLPIPYCESLEHHINSSSRRINILVDQVSHVNLGHLSRLSSFDSSAFKKYQWRIWRVGRFMWLQRVGHLAMFRASLSHLPPDSIPFLHDTTASASAKFTSFSVSTSQIETRNKSWAIRADRTRHHYKLIQSGTFGTLCWFGRRWLNRYSFQDVLKAFFRPIRTTTLVWTSI